MHAGSRTVRTHRYKWRQILWNFLKALPFWLLIGGFILIILGMTVTVFLSAFSTHWFGTVLPAGFTFSWFTKAWSEYDIWLYFKLSLETTFIATAISLVLSVPGAYVFARRDFPLKSFLLGFYQLPFMLPELAYALPVAAIFYKLGLAETFTGLIIVQLLVGIPFSMVILIPFIEALDPRLEIAAQSLGADRLRMFSRIVVPQLIPGITASAINIFIRMFGAFVVILLISGPKMQTLNVMVFSVLSATGSQPQPMLDSLTLSLMLPLLLFTFLSMWVSRRLQRRVGK
ncbi:Binding-protein-dependent transport system inner membrane component [Acididesulfobacillus acetoxydans]|uniref:Binding-protein-dependent transport system inner membrane component n=1 Tax=Acididesulfobacillus acetoxydans TaxID=1561005 RepID=A0A8S0W4U7_9FIRM|nr:ABC transporter permease subunit [Acididesulfobacillus acetoxydans]CAA7602618.1 Binding-protein-dependent transport system inner membrane component [Acididesulfobacillus acetoxydans]CEJ09185.1 Binding-protein-dependent transport systems inner membrane component [Acididesulfobacillus acetoxydans]